MERWLKQLSCRALLSIPSLAPLMPLNWAEVIISRTAHATILFVRAKTGLWFSLGKISHFVRDDSCLSVVIPSVRLCEKLSRDYLSGNLCRCGTDKEVLAAVAELANG